MNDIQLAAFKLDIKNLRQLLKAGECHDGTLLAACSSHEPDPNLQQQVIELLVLNSVNINETDKNGVSPLHRAVRFRSLEAVSALIRQGADVNLIDKRSHASPLHRAVVNTGAPTTAGTQQKARQIARFLLQHGADQNIRNKKGKVPADYIKDMEMAEIFSSR